MKPAFVLLNPPGSQIVIRDCYCCSTTKADYYWHPLDLLVQSGFLSESFHVVLVDAMAERLGDAATLRRILDCRPRAILSLTSWMSWKEERVFLSKVKQATGASIFASGDLVRFHSEEVLHEEGWLDGVLLDFTTPDLVDATDGRYPSGTSIAHRRNGSVVSGSVQAKTEYGYPIPRHDLFWRLSYRFPFPMPEPVASVLVTHGCPFSCSFCNCGKVHLGFRYWENLEDELIHLSRVGARSIQFRDPTLNIDKEHVLRLCDLLGRRYNDIPWFCYARPDRLDEETVERMAVSGCRFIGLGIESGNTRILSAFKERFDLAAMREALRACRRHGIRTLGHFILGLPGEDRESLEETERLIRGLPIDFVSVNLFEPRPGASLGWERKSSDQTVTQPAMDLSKARRRLLRRFYLRPRHLLRLMTGISSPTELAVYLKNGWRVFFPAKIRRKER